MLPGPFRDRERANSPFWGRNFIDELFRELGAGFFGNGIGGFGGTDIYEKDGNLYYELELPDKAKSLVYRREES